MTTIVPAFITIHTVEVVARKADGECIPGSTWLIVSAETPAAIEARFAREQGDVLDEGEYFTAHRIPGTAIEVPAEA